jgi:hypothetical protein
VEPRKKERCEHPETAEYVLRLPVKIGTWCGVIGPVWFEETANGEGHHDIPMRTVDDKDS